MELKETSLNFAKEAGSFFLWGSLLLAGFGIYPEFVRNEIQNIFFESMAFKTIIAVFFITITASGLFLLIMGPLKEGAKFKASVYKYLVLPPAKFGINFCAVAFGLILSVALVCRGYGYDDAAASMLVSSVYVIVFTLMYWGLTKLVHEKHLKPVTSKHARLGGFLLILSVPILTYVAYPV
ncbi:hypothetical protein BTA51_28740 [Hahella sp. CCB-MM4]|uniref:hypothetical protein n=1 Tax=Hahella sp. (strain CCB-MM4) TaxID=1926491 RepID=UPI000B9B89B5|nr:hypothetical protein [Hahella sp. CCB-MM4]OZG69911.1 hypothetical protein BTA51_28740 [Hahella sp. CCB-MM4]